MGLLSSSPFILTELPDLKPRNPGMHLGTVGQDWGQSIGKIRRYKGSGKEPASLKRAYFEEGFIFEDVLSAEFDRCFKARQRRRLRLMPQREIVEDGIWMTPDWVELGGEIVVIESKYTRTAEPESADKLLDGHWAWGVATKGYARALRTTKVRFIVLWAGGRKPDCQQYEWEYTQGELDKNWEAVLKHRDLMVKRARRSSL